MFATVPVFNSGASEEQIIRLYQIRHIKPHADVTVDSVATTCCEVVFSETDTIVVLLDISTMKDRLQALTGVVDEYGSLT